MCGASKVRAMFDNVDLPTKVSLVIAIYAAALSTYIIIRDSIKDRRRLKVSCNVEAMQLGSGEPPIFVVINFTNVGHRPITITNGGFKLSDGREYIGYQYPPGVKLPKTLGDGEAIKLTFPFNNVKGEAKRLDEKGIQFIHAFGQDAEGKVHKTSKLPRDSGLFGPF